MAEVMVGDQVLVRGTALEVAPGVGVLVQVFSKTDELHIWVREDLVELVEESFPPEPPDGTWLVGASRAGSELLSVFHRDGPGGPQEIGRRFDLHWLDVAAGEWVDWPEACRRGANPDRRLTEEVHGG